MRDAPLSRYTFSQADGVCTVTPMGEFDYSCSHDLAALLVEQLSLPNIRGVAVDMSHVRFFDSTALTSLITAYDTAINSGRVFGVVNPSAQIHRVLKVTGLLDLLTAPALR